MTTSARATAALGGLDATLAVARVTLVRAMRNKSLWVAAFIAFLPEVFAGVAVRDPSIDRWEAVLAMWITCMTVATPVLLAASIGEEFEERTMTYLWSRPLPRWSILTGKLVALVPILWLIGAAGLMLPWFTVFGRLASEHPSVLTDSLIGSAFGAIGLAAAVHFIASLSIYPHSDNVPKPVLLEYDLGENPLRSELLTTPLLPVGNAIPVPQGPGLGIEIDMDALERYAVR